MDQRDTQIDRQVMAQPTRHRIAKPGSWGWWRGLALVGMLCGLCACANTQPAPPPAVSYPAQPVPLQLARNTAQPDAPHPLTGLSATSPQNPLDAWPNSVPPQASATDQTTTAPALSMLAYEKMLLDRVSPTVLRHQAITALSNATALQVERLSEAALIAIVLDTLHHSGQVRTAARTFIVKFAGTKVARAYEAVLADLRANTGSDADQGDSHHQDWLARIGLDMYCEYGERQLQHMVTPTTESRMQLNQAIVLYQKAWALRTLASAEQQHLFPKALYGWAHALEDRAWMERDSRGVPHIQYTQEARAKYQEFLTEARQHKGQAQGQDYLHRAHLYHAESQQEQPAQRGSLKALAWRVLSLTGSFETGADEPNNFAGLSGNFDGQGISFGALQWNIGQQTLPKLLVEIDRQQANLVQRTFDANYDAFRDMLGQDKNQQLAWAKSIQNGKFILHDPWRKAFVGLGTRYDFQKIQVEHADHLFQRALKLCQAYQVRSERAVALMFDILVQNGGVKKKTRAKILSDFQALHPTGNAAQDEVARLRIIANRVAESSNAKWVADVRTRKLAIANGAGTVHGKKYNLAERKISLDDYQTRKPLGATPAASPPVNQAGRQSKL